LAIGDTHIQGVPNSIHSARRGVAAGPDHRFYKAEDCMLALHGDHPLTLAEIRAYVLDLIAQDWFRRSWPQPMRFQFRDGRGDRHARCKSSDGLLFQLYFPRATRTEYFVLHEVAHACTWNTARTDHDRAFMKALLVLVRKCMGRSAAELLRKEWRAAGLAA